MSPISPMIPILQRLIDATTIPLWIIGITMLALAVRACWHTYTR